MEAAMTTVGARDESPFERQARESQARLDVLLAKPKLSWYQLNEAKALAMRGGTPEQHQRVNERMERARARKAQGGDRPATLGDVQDAFKTASDKAVDRIMREIGLLD
jgi:hypothetical protein